MKFARLKQFTNYLVRVSNYDFCPNVNGLVYWLKEPIGWVVTAIAFSILVGLLIGPQGYVLAFAFFALLVLGLLWPWLSMRGVKCQIVLPERHALEQEELNLILRVTNFWPLPVFGMLVKGNFLQAIGDVEEPVAFSLKRVAAWSETEFTVPIKPQRRGQLPSGKVSIASGFPFGLVDIANELPRPLRLLVWPSCTSLRGFPISEANRFSLQGALRDQSGDDGDSIGVRGYQNGDRMRNIHWAQSIRSQKLMVRERQTISSTEANVVLDLSPSEHAGDGVDSSYEWSIRVAASICRHLHEAHAPVRLFCVGLPGLLQSTANNQSGLRAIMDFLAKLPTLSEGVGFTKLANSNGPHPDFGSLNHILGCDSRIFLICTKQSSQATQSKSRGRSTKLTPIIVDIEGFKSDRQTPCGLNGQALTPMKSDATPLGVIERDRAIRNPIMITTPTTAASQLTTQWNRSFSDGN